MSITNLFWFSYFMRKFILIHFIKKKKKNIKWIYTLVFLSLNNVHGRDNLANNF